jgi:anti-sigma factor RsiW
MRRTSDLSQRELQKISSYLDGLLTPLEADAFERSLKSDEELAWALVEIRKTKELIGSLPPLTAPRSFALSPEMAGLRMTRPSPLLRYATAIAMLAFTFTLGADLLLNMAGGMMRSAPAMEVMSDMVLEAAPLEAVGDEELPALREMDPAAGEFSVEEPAVEEPAAQAMPAPDMELPDEAALPDEAEAESEELQIMAVPPDDDNRMEESQTLEAFTEESQEGFDAQEAPETQTGDTAGISGKALVEDSDANDGIETYEVTDDQVGGQRFWSRIIPLRAAQILLGSLALILTGFWLYQRKSA